MRSFITLALILTSLFSFSQSVVGKWKPVFFTMDTLMRADVKADTFFINKAMMTENFKNDKDPEFSMQMMEMLFKGLFRNLKEVEEEYFEDGSYKETNMKAKKMKTGKWVYDEKENILTKTISPATEAQHFSVRWSNGQLVLTTELGSGSDKKGNLEIIYEKI